MALICRQCPSTYFVKGLKTLVRHDRWLSLSPVYRCTKCGALYEPLWLMGAGRDKEQWVGRCKNNFTIEVETSPKRFTSREGTAHQGTIQHHSSDTLEPPMQRWY